MPNPHVDFLKLFADIDQHVENLARINDAMSEHHQHYREGLGSFVEFFLTLPCPAWVKTWPELNMLYVNRAYEESYGVYHRDYTGGSDVEFWSSEESEIFNANDIKVGEMGQGFLFEEDVFNPKTKCQEHLWVYKWPIMQNTKIVGVAGMVLAPRYTSELNSGANTVLHPADIVRITETEA